MRFSILKGGTIPRNTRERLGDYGDIFRALLGQPGQDWEVHDVEHDEFPASLSEYDGFVITGSPASAFDDEPWIHELLRLIRECREREILLLGGCFGSQAITQALGGEVASNPAGWEIGVKEMELSDAGRALPSLAMGPMPLHVLELHQDITTRPPPDAVVLASSRHTPIEIFSVGERILCLQGHPEMDNECVQEIISKRLQRGSIDPAKAEEGLASLRTQPHRSFWETWLRAFLREGRLSAAA